MQHNKRLEKLILAGLMTALITVLTIVVAIPIPIVNGYVHLGDSMIFLAVLLLGWKYGAVAAALGSALADFFLGYVYYAPWTFFIKGGMALIMGLLIHEGIKSKKHLVLCSIVVAALWVLLTGFTQVITTGEADMQFGILILALAIPIILIVFALLVNKKENVQVSLPSIVGMTGGGLFMVFGYFVSGGILYGNWVASAVGIPPNIIQFMAGFVIAAVVYAALSKTPLVKKGKND